MNIKKCVEKLSVIVKSEYFHFYLASTTVLLLGFTLIPTSPVIGGIAIGMSSYAIATIIYEQLLFRSLRKEMEELKNIYTGPSLRDNEESCEEDVLNTIEKTKKTRKRKVSEPKPKLKKKES